MVNCPDLAKYHHREMAWLPFQKGRKGTNYALAFVHCPICCICWKILDNLLHTKIQTRPSCDCVMTSRELLPTCLKLKMQPYFLRSQHPHCPFLKAPAHIELFFCYNVLICSKLRDLRYKIAINNTMRQQKSKH